MTDLDILAKIAILHSREKEERKKREDEETFTRLTAPQKEALLEQEIWAREEKQRINVKYSGAIDETCLLVIEQFERSRPFPSNKVSVTVPLGDSTKNKKITNVVWQGYLETMWKEMITNRMISLGFFVWDARFVYGEPRNFIRPVTHAELTISIE